MARPRTNTVPTMIRINKDLKKQAETVCEEMGMTLSLACTIFFNAVVKTHSIPFRIQTFDLYGSEKNQDYDTDCLQGN